MKNVPKIFLAGAALVAVHAKEAARADMPAQNDDRLRIEEPAPAIKELGKIEHVYRGPLFKIDAYTAAREGTQAERKALLDQLLGELTIPENSKKEKDSQGNEYDFFEKSYPLLADGKNLEIKVSLYPDRGEVWFRIIDPNNRGVPVVLIDSGMTGTPSPHQLPVEIHNRVRPQDFAIFTEDVLATKLYFGLLKHLLSRQ